MVTVTSDNRFIVSHSEKSIKVFDFETKHEVHHFENVYHESKKFIYITSINSSEKIDSLAVTSKNRFIISSSGTDLIKIFDLENEREQVLGKAENGKIKLL